MITKVTTRGVRSGPGIRDLADRIKTTLTARDVAERYGFHPNRSGFIQCPFHQGDHTASLKLYDRDGGWHCFGCNEGGSVIDFVMKLFGLDFRDAVRKMAADFFGERLDMPPEDRAKIEEAKQRAQARSEIQAERDRLAEREKELIGIKKQIGDRVADGEQYLNNPSEAPGWWVDACFQLTLIEAELEGICLKDDELRMRAKESGMDGG